MVKLISILLALLFSLWMASCSQSSPPHGAKNTSDLPQHAESGSLAIEAGLILRSADVKPVARVEFSLLNRDLETILAQSDYMLELPKDMKKIFANMIQKTSEKHVGVLTMLVKKSGNDEVKNLELLTQFKYSIARAVTATKPFVVQSVTTNFQGKARLSNIPAGTYYLFGYSNVGPLCQ